MRGELTLATRPTRDATSIYLSGETRRKAAAIAERSGESVGGLFRAFIDFYDRRADSAIGNPWDQLALVLGGIERIADPIPGAPPRLIPAAERDPFEFDTWLGTSPDEMSSVERVFLMGTTLGRALCLHEPTWGALLKGGSSLSVLLQGNRGSESEPVYSISRDDSRNPEEIRRRERSVHVLERLAQIPDAELQVRNSGNLWIPYSAVLVYRVDKTIDIQIGFYQPECWTAAEPRVFLSTQQSSEIAMMLLEPIDDIWSNNSVSEFGSS